MLSATMLHEPTPETMRPAGSRIVLLPDGHVSCTRCRATSTEPIGWELVGEHLLCVNLDCRNAATVLRGSKKALYLRSIPGSNPAQYVAVQAGTTFRELRREFQKEKPSIKRARKKVESAQLPVTENEQMVAGVSVSVQPAIVEPPPAPTPLVQEVKSAEVLPDTEEEDSPPIDERDLNPFETFECDNCNCMVVAEDLPESWQSIPKEGLYYCPNELCQTVAFEIRRHKLDLPGVLFHSIR